MATRPVPTPTRTRSTTRTLAGSCLIGSGVALVVSQLCWPDGSDADTATMLRAAAAHPIGWTMACVLETVAGLLSVAGALGVQRWLRNRGRVLGLLGAIGTVLGAVAFASSGVANVASLTLAQHLPNAQAVVLENALTSQPYFAAVFPLFYLNMIAGILLLIGACRGGLVPWWTVVLGVVASVVASVVNNGLNAPFNALTLLPQLALVIFVGSRLIMVRQAESATVARSRGKVGQAPAEDPVAV